MRPIIWFRSNSRPNITYWEQIFVFDTIHLYLFYEYTKTNTTMSSIEIQNTNSICICICICIHIHICKTNSNLLFDLGANRIVKSTIFPSSPLMWDIMWDRRVWDIMSNSQTGQVDGWYVSLTCIPGAGMQGINNSSWVWVLGLSSGSYDSCEFCETLK